MSNKDEDFKLLKIQTIILRVNIDCDGCKQKVKRLLQRIEGVYTVSIEAEQQKVRVSGNLDSATLIKKLARAGKHAELWNQKARNSTNHRNDKHSSNQQCQQTHSVKDSPVKNNNGSSNNNTKKKPQTNQALLQDLNAFKNLQPKLDSDSSEDEFCDEDVNNEDEDGIGFIGNKLNQLNLLKQSNQAALAAANAKKNGTGGNGEGKKGASGTNQNNGGMRSLNVLNNTQNATLLSNGMMGNGGLEGLTNGFPSSTVGGVFGGSNNPQCHPSTMMMNLRNLSNNSSMNNMNSVYNNGSNLMMNGSKYMQPQLMYSRSPQIPPFGGYYPNPYYFDHINNSSGKNQQSEDFDAHFFSDENTSSCAIM